jgi:hypothetical protein
VVERLTVNFSAYDFQWIFDKKSKKCVSCAKSLTKIDSFLEQFSQSKNTAVGFHGAKSLFVGARLSVQRSPARQRQAYG